MLSVIEPYGAAIVAVTLIVLFVAFVREWRSPEVSAGLAVVVLLGLGVISVDDVLGTLSNSAPVTIAAMFVISASLVRTGAIDAFTAIVTRRAAASPRRTLFFFFIAIAAMSAFMNNTPLVMLMIPVAVALAREMGVGASKLLIPVSFVAVLGGLSTLVGTSTNILVDSVAQQYGLEPFGIFEIAPVGVAMSLVGIVVILFAMRLLPDRTTVSSLGSETRRYVLEAVIEDTSPNVGKRARDVAAFNRSDTQLIDVLRATFSLRRHLNDVVLQPGDVVVLRTSVAELLSLKEEGNLAVHGAEHMQSLGTRNSHVFEILMGPGAGILGKTLRHLRLRRRYGVYPIALHRRGANLAERFETTPLEVGDTLLIEGSREELERLVEDYDLVNVSEPTERAFRRAKAPIAIVTMLGVVVGAAFGVMEISGLALIGAVIVLVTRSVEPDEAVQAVDWRILGLIVAMLAVGVGMEKVGLVDAMVGAVAPYLGQFSPIFALGVIYLLATILTEILTNNAVAVVLTPIAISLATAIGADPRPFVVAVMMAASASFLTPIGYQTNTLVYSAGGYKFFDFFRVGIWVNIAVFIVAMVVIPVVWPL